MEVESTFQHLECVNPKLSDIICVIGRQANGQSVCVKIENVQPHLCVRNELNLTADMFEQLLNNKNVFAFGRTVLILIKASY